MIIFLLVQKLQALLVCQRAGHSRLCQCPQFLDIQKIDAQHSIFTGRGQVLSIGTKSDSIDLMPLAQRK